MIINTVLQGGASSSGGSGEVLPEFSGGTFSATASEQTVLSPGHYNITGAIKVAGYPSSVSAQNIKVGASIYGISGNYTAASTMTQGYSVASSNQLLTGYGAWVNGQEIHGNIPIRTSLSLSGSTVRASAGYYNADKSLSVSAGSVTMPTGNDAKITANPSINITAATGYVTATVQATKSITPIVSAGYVTSASSGTITVVGNAGYNLPQISGSTWTPGTANKTIDTGYYLTGQQVILGDENLISSNIRSGISIFGVPGSAIVDTSVDYVIEEGESTTQHVFEQNDPYWRYRKWNSGKLEIWASDYFNGDTGYNKNYTYYLYKEWNIKGRDGNTVPSTVNFSDIPIVQLQIRSSQSVALLGISAYSISSSGVIKFNIFSPYSAIPKTYVDCYAVGRWT